MSPTATALSQQSTHPARARTMRAAILVRQQAPLEVAELTIPALDVGQVLVKLAFSGICGKQLDEISGVRGADAFLPHLLGHEGSGIVQEVGPGVRKVKPGDHVILHWVKSSGIDSSPPRFTWNGAQVSAGWVTTFSDYTIASENRLTPIAQDVPLDIACLLGCAVTTGLGIVFNNADLKPGQSIAVFGVGGVGLNVLQGAALVNAHPIIAVDIHDRKLAQAKTFGATHTINATGTDVKRALRDLSGGRGIDVTVDLTGQGTVRETAYDSTSATGRTIFGGVPPHDSQLRIDSFPIHFGRRLIGVHGGDTRPEVDIPRYLQLHRLGKLKLEEQITHRMPLAKVNEAIAVVQQGGAGRCVLVL